MKRILISVAVLFALLAIVFAGAVWWAKQNGPRLVQEWKEQNLNAEVSTSGFGFSVRPFGIAVYDLKIIGKEAPFEGEMLLESKEIALKVKIMDLFKGKATIEQVLLDGTKINLLVNEEGQANFDIYKGISDTTASTQQKETDSVKKKPFLNLTFNVQIINSSVRFEDKSLAILFDARGINYLGIGRTDADSVFHFSSAFLADSLNIVYNNVEYFDNKRGEIDFELIYDQHRGLSLDIKDMLVAINKLPMRFNASFEQVMDTVQTAKVYKVNLNLQNKDLALGDLFTALPTPYLGWLERTKVEGIADYMVNINGLWSSDSIAPLRPDARMHLTLRDGYIANKKVNVPIKDLFLDFDVSVPKFNIDSAKAVLDTLYFNVGKDYLSAKFKAEGELMAFNEVYLNGAAKTSLDLKQWIETLGFDDFDVKGKFSLDAKVDGAFKRDKKGNILAFPRCEVNSNLRDGYFKYAQRPSPIENVSYDIHLTRKDDGTGIHFSLINLNADLLTNYIRGDFKSQFILGSQRHLIDANLKAFVNLADIERVIPKDTLGFEVSGKLFADVNAKGIYDHKKQILPYGVIDVKLNDGYLKKLDRRFPVTKITLDAKASRKDGNAPLHVAIHPFSFDFQGNPFKLDAEFGNLKDPYYDFSAKGLLNLEAVNVILADTTKSKAGGLIEVNIASKGTVKDIQNKAFDKLKNSGSIRFENVYWKHEQLPYSVRIKSGEASIANGDFKLDNFKARYGKSNMTLNGLLSNIPNYVLYDGVLKGDFTFASTKIAVADLMALSPENSKGGVAEIGTDAEENAVIEPTVLMLPANIDFNLRGYVKQVLLGKQILDSCTANVQLKDGEIRIRDTGVGMIGCRVDIGLTYKGISKNKAYFDYHITANDFDIQRAYKEVDLFRELVSSAETIHGIISLDYHLKGYLNKNMEPIMPSIEGGGVLTLRDVQIKGMKMFGEVSKKTKKNELNNPNLREVAIKTHIKDNIITIEPVELKIAGFKPKMSGQTSFNGQLRLQMKIGMPLGIASIPISITGTSDNPVVTINKKAEKSAELDGTEYIEVEEEEIF